MANADHLAKLKQAVDAREKWRDKTPYYDWDQYQKLPFSGFDLSGADLRELNLGDSNLSQADLRNADLRGASLYGTNFSAAQLNGANLTRTDLTGTDLSGTDLSGANLSSLYPTYGSAELNLRGAILKGIILAGSRLNSINLKGVDLQEADLRGAHLMRADLEQADLRKADLSGAVLTRANLDNADLSGALLVRAELNHANLRMADLREANLKGAILRDAILSSANMRNANLREAEMAGAFLRGVALNGANLAAAKLNEANLFEANLGGAILQHTSLKMAVLTDCRLWDTLRSGWRIEGIICKRIYWDESGGTATNYAPGEFERLYAEQTVLELFYQDGISTFELSTLPALLQHLSAKHPGATIQLKTIEQTGGGAKITISLGDADDSLKQQIEAEAVQVVRAQLALRENDNLRLQIQNEFLREQHQETVRLMLSAAAPQITFNAPVHTAALPSGHASVELHQTFNDNTELLQLIDKLLTRNTELTTAQTAEIETAKTELQKPNPDKSRLTHFYGFLKRLPAEAILKAAGKLGEKATTADWSSLLHQVEQCIHHVH